MTAVSFAVWLLALLFQWAVTSRSRSDAVGPASILAAVAAPIVHLVIAERPWNSPELSLTAFVLLLAALVVLKHRSNIAKLLGRAQNAYPSRERNCAGAVAISQGDSSSSRRSRARWRYDRACCCSTS